jgi:hypothetical protein
MGKAPSRLLGLGEKMEAKRQLFDYGFDHACDGYPWQRPPTGSVPRHGVGAQ